MNTSKSLQVSGSYNDIFKRTFPVIISFFIPQFNYLINTIFIGHIDTFHLGVGAIVSLYYLVFSIIGIGFNNGIQIIIAYFAGKDDRKNIQSTFFNACLWAVLISGISILFTFTLMDPYFRWTLNDPHIIQSASDFLKIRIWGLPFLYLYLLRNALYINYNSTTTLILFSLFEAAINIILDYGLIFGNLGLPRLGFQGAAYASLIAEVAGFIAVIIHLKRYPLEQAKYKITYKFAFDAEISKKILKTTLPIALQMALSVISWEITFSFIANRSETFLAASNILRNIFSIMSVLVWGIGNTTNSIISNLYGQEKIKEMHAFIRRVFTVSWSITLLAAVVLYLGRPLVVSLFSSDPTVAALLQSSYVLILITINISSVSGIFFNAILPLEKGKNIILIEIISVLAYCTYAYLMANYYRLSLTWIWSSEILYTVLLGVCSFYFLRRKLRQPHMLCARYNA